MVDTEQDDILHIHLEIGDRSITLGEFKAYADALQNALNTLAKDITGSTNPDIDYAIADAKPGSLTLGIKIMAANAAAFATLFTNDLAGLNTRQYRSDLPPTLFRAYTRLVRCLGDKNASVSYRYGSRTIEINPQFRKIVQTQRSVRIIRDTTVHGTLESVNAHGSLFAFYLYPKLEDHDRIECIFPQRMLPIIAEILKRRSVVEITGKAKYAPLGTYPERIIVEKEPIALDYNAAAMVHLVRSLDLIPKGLNKEQYIQLNREAAGLA